MPNVVFTQEEKEAERDGVRLRRKEIILNAAERNGMSRADVAFAMNVGYQGFTYWLDRSIRVSDFGDLANLLDLSDEEVLACIGRIKGKPFRPCGTAL